MKNVTPLLISISLAVFASSCKEKTPSPAPAQQEATGHLVNDHPTFTSDSMVNVLVEIPAGTQEKWEVDKASGKLKLQQENNRDRIVRYLPYPGNYGMIPRTLLPKENGGDGDPLDVIILGSSVERGSLVPVRLIGVLEMLDNGEQDDKLIAVPAQSVFDDVSNMSTLDERFIGVSEIVRTWFANYKGPGVVQIKQYAGPDRAREILNQAVRGFGK